MDGMKAGMDKVRGRFEQPLGYLKISQGDGRSRIYSACHPTCMPVWIEGGVA